MIAFRLLILLVLAYVFVVIIYKCFLTNRTERLRRSQEHPDQEQELVRCFHCQSYVPRTDAVSSRDYCFCSEECVRLFVRRDDEESLKGR
jgi:hypothetical protein